MLAKYVFDQIRPLLDDARGGFATDTYLAPFVNLAQDMLIQDVLNIPDLGQLTAVVVLPNVPAGTDDLQSYFEAGNELELLTGLLTMKERPVSGSRQEQDWVRMNPVHDLPTITPSSFNSFYHFTGDSIHLPGADQTMDLRVYGKFQPQPVKDATSPVVPSVTPILTFGAAALAALSRGNTELADRFDKMRLAVQQSYLTNQIMELQAVRVRLGSFSGRGTMR